jgi:hypothetical protein
MRPTRLAFYQDRWWRILCVSFVIYVLSFIDRTNIAMAIPAVRGKLHISAVAIGEATSVFFWGYIVLQIRVGRLAGVWSANRARSRQHRVPAEPGDRADDRQSDFGLCALGVRLANYVPAEGAARSAGGWLWLWAIADSPAKASWLAAAERDRLIAGLAAENATIPPRAGHWLAVLYSCPVILLVLYNFGAPAAEWGIGFRLPSVVEETGTSIGFVGVLIALPYAAGATMMVLVARSSDRRSERSA